MTVARARVSVGEAWPLVHAYAAGRRVVLLASLKQAVSRRPSLAGATLATRGLSAFSASGDDNTPGAVSVARAKANWWAAVVKAERVGPQDVRPTERVEPGHGRGRPTAGRARRWVKSALKSGYRYRGSKQSGAGAMGHDDVCPIVRQPALPTDGRATAGPADQRRTARWRRASCPSAYGCGAAAPSGPPLLPQPLARNTPATGGVAPCTVGAPCERTRAASAERSIGVDAPHAASW
jgi:hypothetical protein